MTDERPVGWHPDPGGSPMLRWWDGMEWADRWLPAADDRHAASTSQAVNLLAVIAIFGVGIAVFAGVLWLLNA